MCEEDTRVLFRNGPVLTNQESERERLLKSSLGDELCTLKYTPFQNVCAKDHLKRSEIRSCAISDKKLLNKAIKS